jgi:hypothetical protein
MILGLFPLPRNRVWSPLTSWPCIALMPCVALGRVRSVLRCPRRTGDDGTIAGSFPLLQHVEKAVQVAASLSQEIGSHTADFLYDRILVHRSILPSALRVCRGSALRTRANDTLARCETDSLHSQCGGNSRSKDSLSHARSGPQCETSRLAQRQTRRPHYVQTSCEVGSHIRLGVGDLAHIPLPASQPSANPFQEAFGRDVAKKGLPAKDT